MKVLDLLSVKKLLKKTKSRISGEIKVFDILRRPSLEVGGLEQSGAFIGGIWKKGLKRAKSQKPLVARCLILGLGGGTAARLVSQLWPAAEIIGIEIDSEVIKLAKKYFKVHQVSHLEIVKADALKWLKRRKEKFDLILMDLYLGDQLPAGSENQVFLKRLKARLNPGGLVIFNRLFYQEKKIQTEAFIKKLSKVFPEISFVRTASNLLILARK